MVKALGELQLRGDSRIGEALLGLKPLGGVIMFLDNGDNSAWLFGFSRDLFVGVTRFAEISTGDLLVTPLFLDFSLPCFFRLPRSARCLSLDRNSFASSFSCLRDLDGEEPVTVTSSSSLIENVDEDVVEMRPLTRGVSGTIVTSVLRGEISTTYKIKHRQM